MTSRIRGTRGATTLHGGLRKLSANRLCLRVDLLIRQIVFVPERVKNAAAVGETYAENLGKVPHWMSSVIAAGIFLDHACSHCPAQRAKHDSGVDEHDWQKNQCRHQHHKQGEAT
jgi:hypothetical protein